mmetsp:Transcript_95546/g.270503  ORF Transcript_95546/g.270503 Transcript_95546/m.270503 type:complete len:312 (+) Transcript_95546:137-1072(+)
MLGVDSGRRKRPRRWVPPRRRCRGLRGGLAGRVSQLGGSGGGRGRRRRPASGACSGRGGRRRWPAEGRGRGDGGHVRRGFRAAEPDRVAFPVRHGAGRRGRDAAGAAGGLPFPLRAGAGAGCAGGQGPEGDPSEPPRGVRAGQRGCLRVGRAVPGDLPGRGGEAAESKREEEGRRRRHTRGGVPPIRAQGVLAGGAPGGKRAVRGLAVRSPPAAGCRPLAGRDRGREPADPGGALAEGAGPEGTEGTEGAALGAAGRVKVVAVAHVRVYSVSHCRDGEGRPRGAAPRLQPGGWRGACTASPRRRRGTRSSN